MRPVLSCELGFGETRQAMILGQDGSKSLIVRERRQKLGNLPSNKR